MATSLENIDKSKVSAQRIEGLTEAIQSELSGAITGGASTIVTNDLTASRALISNANGKVAVSSITSTKLGYLTDVTSNIQSQIDGKQATITGGATSVVSNNLTASRALVSDSSGKIGVSSITSTKLGYLTDVTSNIQAQINNCSQAIVGSIIPYAGSSAPSGYLLCDGSAISRTTYSALFAVIGTTYGEGDGNSTFNIPDIMDNRSIVGIDYTQQYLGYNDNGQLPNITGSGIAAYWYEPATSIMTGAFAPVDETGLTPSQAGASLGPKGFTFDASRCSDVYLSGRTEVIPKRIVMGFYIKY